MRQCSEAREDPQVVAALQAVLQQQEEGEREVEEEKEAKEKNEEMAVNLHTLFTHYTEVCATHYEFVRSLRHAADVAMERKQFLSLCTDAKLINRTRFTVSDCNEVSVHSFILT